MSRYYDEDMDEYVEVKSDAAEQRQYFKKRVWTIADEKDEELRRQFGLIGDDMPRTPQEFIDRILAGRYVVPEKYKDYNSYGAAVQYIEWRDPKIVKDEDGFQKAKESFAKDRDHTIDAVMALPAADALAAVQKLEAWTTA